MIFDIHYLILGLIVMAINIVPGFMPPTWIILSYYLLQYHLDFLTTIFLGVIMATIGRLILATLAKTYLQPILPKKESDNMVNFGKIFDVNKNFTFVSFLTFSLLPIPTNQLFIAAGLSKINLSILAISFFIGTTISYSFWISLYKEASGGIENIFINTFSKPEIFMIEFFGFAILYIISRINWNKTLIFLKKRISQDESDRSK